MAILNVFLGRAFDLVLAPFQRFPPIVGLAVISLLTAVPMLLVFKAASDQRRIADVKRAIVAALFEIRLFNDDLPAIFRAQAEILRRNATYLRLSLAPMLWLIVPIGLVVAQLEFHYAYGGLTTGQAVLVKAQLRGSSATKKLSDGQSAPPGESSSQPVPAATLDVPEHVRVLSPAVWFPGTNEVIWEIAPEAPGEYELRARIGGETFTKTLEATDRVARRSPVRLERGFFTQLMYPSEPPLPDAAAVTAISVRYPTRDIRLFGWECPWWIVYFGLSIVFAMLLRRPFNVTV